MRIAAVSSPVTPLRPAQSGGAQSAVTHLAVGLAARGHHVTLYCAEGSRVDGVEIVTVPVDSRAVGQGLVMPGGPPPQPSLELDSAIGRLFVEVERRGADAVSQHAFDAAAFERSRGLPVLHTLHLPPIVESVLHAARGEPASKLAAVSEAGRRDWAAAGVEVGYVLRNGVETSLPRHGPVLRMALAAGRLSPEKGFDHAARAARLAGLPLRVVGLPYAPGYLPDLDGAKLMGPLPRAELTRLMAESAVTICAVRWEEPFGLVAAEAQMAGCPVAGYRRGALPEVIEEGISGILVEPDDVETLGTAVRDCLRLDRGAVRASALRRLAIEGMLDEYERALKSVAA